MSISDYTPNTDSKTESLRAICILGMHRSGTSCLAGCLQENGLYLGDVINQAPHNVKGNKENLIVRDINDSVLLASGGSWDNPPAELSWDDHLRKRRDELIANYSEYPNWGFKDPRTLLTLPFWLEALPNMFFVGTFRHPEAVAHSFKKRENMDPHAAITLWKKYNLKLIEYKEKYGFPLVCFDWAEDRYLKSVTNISKYLGLYKFQLKVETSFYEKYLRHHYSEGSDQNLPEDVMEIYSSLILLSDPN